MNKCLFEKYAQFFLVILIIIFRMSLAYSGNINTIRLIESQRKPKVHEKHHGLVIPNPAINDKMSRCAAGNADEYCKFYIMNHHSSSIKAETLALKTAKILNIDITSIKYLNADYLSKNIPPSYFAALLIPQNQTSSKNGINKNIINPTFVNEYDNKVLINDNLHSEDLNNSLDYCGEQNRGRYCFFYIMNPAHYTLKSKDLYKTVSFITDTDIKVIEYLNNKTETVSIPSGMFGKFVIPVE